MKAILVYPPTGNTVQIFFSLETLPHEIRFDKGYRAYGLAIPSNEEARTTFRVSSDNRELLAEWDQRKSSAQTI